MFSDITTLKKSKILSNWPKWLVVTQSILFGSQDLEIRSHVSSFSAKDDKFSHSEKYYVRNIIKAPDHANY